MLVSVAPGGRYPPMGAVLRLLNSLPGNSLAGVCPRHVGAGVILFLVSARWRSYNCLVQFTNRRIRTFITIPSAMNMNNTDDPP